MRSLRPLNQILETARPFWDQPHLRAAVRENFTKMLECRTPVLGAEIYASDTEYKICPHTCKSRFCPSCGYRASDLWQREQWSILPDVPYLGICFTVPDVLRPFFRQNRDLLHDLPALGAEVIQQWVKLRYGVGVLIMVVQQTFGGYLNFHPHLHVIVSAGGLHKRNGWIGGLRFNSGPLMRMWRYAVITYLRQALRTGLLRSDLQPEQLRQFLKSQYERPWIIHIGRRTSKRQLLGYAGRYLRRPPIAMGALINVTDSEVEFWAKDSRQKRRVRLRQPIAEFVSALSEHVPDRYRHAVRYFGLLAPRAKSDTFTWLFALLGQERRNRPRRLPWAESIEKDFGVNPLMDSHGQRMRWLGRLRPTAR
jgi:hypothetical protein